MTSYDKRWSKGNSNLCNNVTDQDGPSHQVIASLNGRFSTVSEVVMITGDNKITAEPQLRAETPSSCGSASDCINID